MKKEFFFCLSPKSPNKVTQEAMTAARNSIGVEPVSLKELSAEWEVDKGEKRYYIIGETF